MPRRLLVLAVCAVVPSALACTPARAVEAKPGAARMRTVSYVAAQQDAQVDASIPTPESVIGHKVGADYKLARWEKIVEYFQKLAAASDRIAVRQIDTTTENNPWILAEISSPETIQRLERAKWAQQRLADPRLIENDAERRTVLAEAKTTILVSCGLHSSEVAASQMSMELAYDLVSGNDARTLEILDNCIILLVPSTNPDGNNKVAEWYERNLGTPFEGARMPWLYQKYGGHDNNRDWFMLNLKETRILTKLLYYEWHPTILHDVHQMGNRGAILRAAFLRPGQPQRRSAHPPVAADHRRAYGDRAAGAR